MSQKPPKKSDLKAGWMKKRRDRPIMIQPEYHLIISEGTKTEPAYFDAIKRNINAYYKNKIHLEIKGVGNNTIALFKEAQNLVRHNPNKYNHVWIVYDTDDFPAHDIDIIVEQCKNYSDSETTYHAIWSNQCIELWFLLHFNYFESDVHRKEYFPKLSSYFKKYFQIEYQKNLSDIFQMFRPYTDIAIKNAKRLHEKNHDKSPSQSAPGTQVYELVELLYPYFK